MKKPLLLFILVSFFSCSLLVENPVQPDKGKRYACKVNLSIQDTLVGGARCNRVAFTPDAPEWPPVYRDAAVKFYRKFGNSEPEPVAVVYFQTQAALTESDTVFYEDRTGRLDTFFCGRAFVLDRADLFDQTELRYLAVAVVDLENTGGRFRQGGLEGDTSYSSPLTGAQAKTRFVINSGATYTEKDVVTLSGTIDTTGADTLYFYRYSAVKSLDSAGQILSFILADSNRVQMRGRNYYWKKDSTIHGLIRKPDTVLFQMDSLARLFDSLSPVAGTPFMRFTMTDTLVPYVGKKWVVMRISRASPAPAENLSSSIDIRPFQAAIQLDKERARVICDPQFNDMICLRSDDIPVYFTAYGDRSFDQNVQVWIATRKTSCPFFTGKAGELTTDKFINEVQLDATYKWPDCIYETVPENLVLNEYGMARASILNGYDYKNGYRVSPLATVKMLGQGYHCTDFRVSDAMVSFKLPRYFTIHLMVKPGSILGYDAVYFRRQDIAMDSALKKTPGAPGWHWAAGDTSSLWKYASIRDYLAAVHGASSADDELYQSLLTDCVLDMEGNLYQHDMRGLPVTSSTVYEGKKEFIILAYAKGKYFDDPRVFISKFMGTDAYYWDKIPPAFTWSIDADNNTIWSPLASAEYAPMCYRDPANPAGSQCTDIASLGGFFNVFLSTRPVQDPWCSVRDAGFARIKSVRLLFNHHDNYLGCNPGTLTRNYLIPTQVVTVPPEKIQQQSRELDTKTQIHTFNLADIAFRNIDCRAWQSGLWDMWIETEDDLGNFGLAPFAQPLSLPKGFMPVRRIEIK